MTESVKKAYKPQVTTGKNIVQILGIVIWPLIYFVRVATQHFSSQKSLIEATSVSSNIARGDTMSINEDANAGDPAVGAQDLFPWDGGPW